MPIKVVIIIPISNAPFTFRASKTPVIIIPIIASKGTELVTSPKVNIVPDLGCNTIWAFSSPIKAIKSPIPTEIAFLILFGIEPIMASRTLKAVSKINIIPSRKAVVNANCQVWPIPITMV